MLALSNTPHEEQDDLAKSFSALFSSTVDSFAIDLTHATLVDVLHQHQSAQRRLSPRYSHSAVISMVLEVSRLSSATVLPSHVNGLFYDYLQQYMLQKGLKYSSIDNYFGQIRSALEWAAKYGCKLAPGYNEYRVKVPEHQRYALTIEEVCLIRNFDLRSLTKVVRRKHRELKVIETKVTRHGKTYYRKVSKYVTVTVEETVPMFTEQHLQVLERVRDMFVLSCCLFQRYSDMRKLCPDNFSDDRQTYRVTQQKTGSKATVVINEISISKDFAHDILRKYGYFAPYNKSINNYNRHLHELLNLIGDRFDDTFEYEEKQMGEIVKFSRKLSQCISSHTARRTAITISTKTNNEFQIRRASGHKDGRSFARYVCFND